MALLKKIKYDNKIGYKDENGSIIIEPVYSDGSEFIESDTNTKYACVAKGALCGIIDQNGNEVIPFEYEEIIHLFGKVFAARKFVDKYDWSFGVLDTNGNILISFRYKYISYSGRLLKCYRNALYTRKYTSHLMDNCGHVFNYSDLGEMEYWLNTNNTLVYYGEAFDTPHSNIIIQKNNKWGVVNNEGENIIETIYDELHCVGKDRFVVRLNDKDNWSFGVINSKNDIIISFDFKYISWESGSFYECYRECNYNRNTKYKWDEYTDKTGLVWFNYIGEIICELKSKILSDNYLGVFSNGRWGVYDQSRRKVLNFLYDDIAVLKDKFIVSIDGNVGVLNLNGGIIISPSYKEIECVAIDDYTHGGFIKPKLYGKYSKNYVFDSEDKDSKFHRKLIRYNSKYKGYGRKYGIDIYAKNDSYDFDNFFILINDDYSEIFLEDIGILENSRFEIIRPLTNRHFAVKKGNKWGVYAADDSKLTIECEYERLKFEGKNVVLISNNNLWGAKTLVDPSYPLFKENFNVNIPIKFKEIKILDEFERLYGVKKESKSYHDEIIEEYTIVDHKGEDLLEYADIYRLDKQCEIIDSNLDRILASQNNKYGFISLDGYISIPFQYDEVILRKDGKIDVRIENRWGVIDISGKEIVNIKYTEKLPSQFENLIVKNSSTERYGVLSDNGTEKIPSIYEHLLYKNGDDYSLFFYGYNGYEDDGEDGDYNFFSGNIQRATWGCIKDNGELIIKAKYDCFKIQDGFILGGRNGSMLEEGQHGHTYFESEYSGVYDLFDFSGKLIIGGFTSFFYNKERKLYCLQFGGKWEQRLATHDEWGNRIDDYSYHFEKGNSRWLVLDNNLISIMRNEDGERCSFSHGFIGKITTKNVNNETVNYWNIALELFSIQKPSFAYNLMICSDNKLQWVVRLSDGLASKKYNHIKVIKDNLFFFTENEQGVGISRFNNYLYDEKPELKLINPSDNNICVITYPVGGYVFTVYNIEGENCSVKLYNINKPEDEPIIAIKLIDKDNLFDKISKGYLLISFDDEKEGYSRIVLPKLNIFDERFQELVSQRETGNTYSPFEKIYWYTNDYLLFKPREDSHFSDGNYDNGNDPMEDTWDALTDGMYGDYPGGDVDYDALGF